MTGDGEKKTFHIERDDESLSCRNVAPGLCHCSAICQPYSLEAGAHFPFAALAALTGFLWGPGGRYLGLNLAFTALPGLPSRVHLLLASGLPTLDKKLWPFLIQASKKMSSSRPPRKRERLPRPRPCELCTICCCALRLEFPTTPDLAYRDGTLPNCV